jgi:hypothetical protein
LFQLPWEALSASNFHLTFQQAGLVWSDQIILVMFVCLWSNLCFYSNSYIDCAAA